MQNWFELGKHTVYLSFEYMYILVFLCVYSNSLESFSSKIIRKLGLHKFDSLHAFGDRPVWWIWPSCKRVYSTVLLYLCPKFEIKILSLTEVIVFTRNGLQTYTHTYSLTYTHTDTQAFLFDFQFSMFWNGFQYKNFFSTMNIKNFYPVIIYLFDLIQIGITRMKWDTHCKTN